MPSTLTRGRAGGREPRSPQPARPIGLSVLGGFAIGTSAALSGASPAAVAMSAAFGAILVWLALHDLATRRIPNRVVYPAIITAIALSWAWDDRGPVELITGGASAFVVSAILSSLTRGGLGGGDVKLITLVGLLVGLANLPLVAVVTALTGGVAATLLLAFRQIGRDGALAYAPFIAIGGIVALLR